MRFKSVEIITVNKQIYVFWIFDRDSEDLDLYDLNLRIGGPFT